jgi:hypothetical protein
MNRNDREALELALEQSRRGPGGVEHVQYLIEDRGWEAGAKFCAHCMQGGNLKLSPWQIPPADIIDPDNPDLGRRLPDQPNPQHSDGRKEAAALLRRMLSLGISQWHPDPIRAIEEAERERRQVKEGA